MTAQILDGKAILATIKSELKERVAALAIDGQKARERALTYSWRACAELFVGHVREAYSRQKR